MPRTVRPTLANGRSRNVRGYPTARTKPLFYTLSKNVIAHHMVDTTEDISLDDQIKNEIEIKNEPPREKYDQSPMVSSEFVDPRITGTVGMYEDEQSEFSALYPEQFQVPSNHAYLSYQDAGGQQIYAPAKYMQVGNVVVQVLDPEPQYYLVNPVQSSSPGYPVQDQAVIKEVPRKKGKQIWTSSSDAVTSQHWADFYVQDIEPCVQETTVQQEEVSDDANKYIIGQDDNEVNVHIITKDGKETTTIINTFREVEQRPNRADAHGENGNCGCKICDGKKKSYVSAFEQFLSEKIKKPVPTCSKKVKMEDCKTENDSSY